MQWKGARVLPVSLSPVVAMAVVGASTGKRGGFVFGIIQWALGSVSCLRLCHCDAVPPVDWHPTPCNACLPLLLHNSLPPFPLLSLVVLGTGLLPKVPLLPSIAAASGLGLPIVDFRRRSRVVALPPYDPYQYGLSVHPSSSPSTLCYSLLFLYFQPPLPLPLPLPIHHGTCAPTPC